MIDSTLSHYRITARLGAGGMGEVYRARDTRLDREVAIKVLPAELAQDVERLARFEREAKLLASLNHPNVAHVYGFEGATLEDGSTAHFLAMELVEGEDLAERLSRGPIPLDDALEIAKQIAEALEEAHERGIVHRDLKPANVKVTPDGRVKVLDFGLAKAWAADPDKAGSGPSFDLSRSPTLAQTGTQAGVILGTAAYMSPEQARGKPVDKRADIWAFGVVLHEMLTGRLLFAGETVSDVLAGVLKTEIDLGTLPGATPPGIRRLLRRCLERDPRNRLHDAADARIVLDEVLRDPAAGEFPLAAAPAPAPASRRRSRVGTGLAAMVVAGLAAWAGHVLGARSVRETATPVHFDFSIKTDPLGMFTLNPVAFSPDGQSVVYTGLAAGSDQGQNAQLWWRRFDREGAEPIPGSEGGAGACFSPDGEWIAYFHEGGLVKQRLRGGMPIPLARAGSSGEARGASWGDDGRIVFSPSYFSPLMQVAAEGGEVRALTQLAANEKSHRFPQVLPGARAVLFLSSASDTASFDEAHVEALDLETGERHFLLEGGAPRYVPPGTLLVARDGRLLAAPFDAKRLAVTGPTTVVLEHLVTSPLTGSPAFDVTLAGDLAYAPGSPELFTTRVARVSPQGQVSLLDIPPRAADWARYSPDGNRIMVRVDSANGQLWSFDVERGSMTRITHDWDADFGTWSPDGDTVYYVLTQGSRNSLVSARADGTGQPESLYVARDLRNLELSGDNLVFSLRSERGDWDVAWMPVGGGQPTLYMATPADEPQAAPSPDGRWIAYVSDESGRPEVYLQSFPKPGRRLQVSAGGGEAPFWRPDGRVLYFRDGEAVMAASVDTPSGASVGKPRELFSLSDRKYGRATVLRTAPDGQGFITIVRDPQWHPADRVAIVLHWRRELEAALAALR